MKLFIQTILLLIVSFFSCYSQPLVSNDGLAVRVDAGLTVTIEGAFTNQTNVSLGTIDNAGTITLTGNWTNNSANTVFSTNTGTVQFIGTTAGQTVGGTNSTGFYNLTINNTFATSPQITLGINTTAKNILTMTAGNINLNSTTLTLGTSTASPGTLSYTAGWLYGGTFTRWFDNTTPNTIPSVVGHFPMGTSTVDYRPLWVGYSAALTTGGTMSVVHNPTYPSGTNPASHLDASWGNTLQGISNSSWVASTANGFASSGSNLSMRFGGTGFGLFALADLDLTLAASVVGTFSAATNVNTPLEVNRNGLSTANLTNTFYIGTKDIAASPLPIELLLFTANCNNQNIILKWSTATETNNDFFTLERSTDGITFTPIGTEKGAGNSSTIKNYSFTDSKPETETVLYYRLKQTDFDGKFEYSAIIVVENCGDALSELFIYPNPTTGKFSIQAPTALSIEIYNVLGEKIYSSQLNSDKTEIDISKQQNDIYLMQVKLENRTVSKKIIINK